MVTADLHGTSIYGRLDVEVQGKKITGEYFGDKFEGSLDAVRFNLWQKTARWNFKGRRGAQERRCYRARWLKTDAADETHSSGTHSSRLRFAKDIGQRRCVMSLLHRFSTGILCIE